MSSVGTELNRKQEAIWRATLSENLQLIYVSSSTNVAQRQRTIENGACFYYSCSMSASTRSEAAAGIDHARMECWAPSALYTQCETPPPPKSYVRFRPAGMCWLIP
eukprot:SAG11_NODE_10957_length_792_cov_1.181556_2_plen_105_part_01